MNKIRNIIILITVGFLFASCNLLDKDPEMDLSSHHVIHDAKSAENAINGLYARVRSGSYYGGIFQMMSDIASDVSQSIGTFDAYIAIDTYQMSSTISMGIGDFWQIAYNIINQSNAIIEAVSGLDAMDQSLKNQFLGEAYFIRALAYFDLNRAFGGIKGVYGTKGVPILLSSTNSIDEITYPSRPEIDAVYQQVESDLLEAKDLLPLQRSTPTRISKAAAEALLSRLYFYYKMDYDAVEVYSTNVIDDYNYRLIDNYADIFIQERTDESIFELPASATEQTSFYNFYFPPSAGARNEFKLHDEFVNFMQSRPLDVRGELIEYSNEAGAYYPTKYQKSDRSDNAQVLRLAEMYLNRAEARVLKSSPDLPGALSDLNNIRNRANLPDTAGTGVDSAEKILHAIEMERNAEFFEEGHRWFDLIRTGRALVVLQNLNRKNGPAVTLSNPKAQVWPIPITETTNNTNLEPNEY